MAAPLVMGVLNVTPDSFSDGGRYVDAEAAVTRGVEMIAEGVSLIDVGGESTRPGADPVDATEECRRVLPVLGALAPQAAAAGVRLSIDTRNEATARAGVREGATLLNDVSASLWPLAAELGVGWVAMHMAGDPRTMQRDPHYDDVVGEVLEFLVEHVELARSVGVGEVWIDPGIGFGKTTQHNLELLAHLDRFVDSGTSVLVGTSRKRFTGELLARSDVAAGDRVAPGRAAGDRVALDRETAGPVIDPVDVEGRLDGSLATATWAMTQGVAMVRAHDVAATVAAATLVAGDFHPR